MLSLRLKKGASRSESYFFWIYLYNLFFILHEFHKIVAGSVPQIGYLLIWTYLATFVSPAPITFPLRMAKNHFEMSPDGSYLFFYDTGPGQHQSFREEKRTRGGTISGTYGYVDPLGVLHITEYVADTKGYRASLEVYEPIRQIPEGPTLIVGPLPADLRSLDEKAHQESVFDKYEFPIEPFESLKIEAPSLIYSSVANKISSSPITTTTTAATTDSKRLSEKELMENDLELNGTSLLMDIKTLQKQLKSLSLLIQEDPLLLIGPLPGDLPKLLSLNNDDEEISKLNRKFRSSFEQEKEINETSTTTNSTEEFMDVGNLPQSEFNVVVPLIKELNYVEKDLVSKGEDINSFLTYPSSGLLQGGVLSPEDKDNSSLTLDNITSDNKENIHLHGEAVQTNVPESIALGKTISTFGHAKNMSSFEEMFSPSDKGNTNSLGGKNTLINQKNNNDPANETINKGFGHTKVTPSSESLIRSSSENNKHSILSETENSFSRGGQFISFKDMKQILHGGISSEDKDSISFERNSGETEFTASEENSFLNEASIFSGDIEKHSLERIVSSSDSKKSSDVEINSGTSDITPLQRENKHPVDKEGWIFSLSDTRETPLTGHKSRLKKNVYRIKLVNLELKDINSVRKDRIGY